MNNPIFHFIYWNVDDLVCDLSYKYIEGLIYSAIKQVGDDINIDDINIDIPKEVIDEWRDKLWKYDVTEWTPRSDDRAFGDTMYTNRLIDVFEYKSYDIRDEICQYIKDILSKE